MRHDPRRRDLATYKWTIELPTRFGDMDPNRHLNNVAVTRLYEEARVRFNWGVRADHSLPRARFLVGHVAVDYLGEGSYPDPVVVGYGIASFGTTSFRAAMGMFQRGVCIGLCDTVMVHRGPIESGGGPAPLPDDLRAALGEWLLHP